MHNTDKCVQLTFSVIFPLISTKFYAVTIGWTHLSETIPKKWPLHRDLLGNKSKHLKSAQHWNIYMLQWLLLLLVSKGSQILKSRFSVHIVC